MKLTRVVEPRGVIGVYGVQLAALFENQFFVALRDEAGREIRRHTAHSRRGHGCSDGLGYSTRCT